MCVWFVVAGLHVALARNVLISDPGVLAMRVLALNGSSGALTNCEWWQNREGMEVGGPRRLEDPHILPKKGLRPDTTYPWLD